MNQPPPSPEYSHWGFISYSHQDRRIAQWLHHALETYPIPRFLVDRITHSGPIPKRYAPIFLDRSDLPGAADLGEKLRQSLRASRFLIVICSPSSAKSRYVNEEIQFFKSLGRTDRVLAVIVSDLSGSGTEGCFPPALYNNVDPDGRLSEDSIEPLAADVRRSGDGKQTSVLKLIAAMSGINLDELKRRDRQRAMSTLARRFMITALLLFAWILAYLVVADAGLQVPGGHVIRRFQDRHQLSIMRPVHRAPKIRTTAAELRVVLWNELKDKQLADGWLPQTPKDRAPVREVWSHSQALAALLRAPTNRSIPQSLARGLLAPFKARIAVEREGIKYGWLEVEGRHTSAIPALWMAIALSELLNHSNSLEHELRDECYRAYEYTQQILANYRTDDDGGWNLYAFQENPKQHHLYSSTMGLMALLHAKEANLPWDGSIEQRDRLLRLTSRWLIERYDSGARRPGWRGNEEDYRGVYDGITLQIYSLLLRAHMLDASIQLPPEMMTEITKHLISCGDRDLSFPVDGGEMLCRFRHHDGYPTVGKEAIKYLWFPWAVECAVQWEQWANQSHVPVEDRVQVRRALGHLVVNLGPEAVQSAVEDWTFVAAETLYGLTALEGPQVVKKQGYLRGMH